MVKKWTKCHNYTTTQAYSLYGLKHPGRIWPHIWYFCDPIFLWLWFSQWMDDTRYLILLIPGAETLKTTCTRNREEPRKVTGNRDLGNFGWELLGSEATPWLCLAPIRHRSQYGNFKHIFSDYDAQSRYDNVAWAVSKEATRGVVVQSEPYTTAVASVLNSHLAHPKADSKIPCNWAVNELAPWNFLWLFLIL